MNTIIRMNITLHSWFECLQICSVICYVISYCKLGHGRRLPSNRRIRRQSWVSCEFMYTPPTRRNSTVSSRRRRRCVLGISVTKCHVDMVYLVFHYIVPHFLLLHFHNPAFSVALSDQMISVVNLSRWLSSTQLLVDVHGRFPGVHGFAALSHVSA